MLFQLLYSLRDEYSWLNVFRYQTFRAMVAFLIAFLFVLLLEPVFIERLKRRGVKGQPIRSDGPQGHLTKSGTPTMGGLVIIVAVVFSTLLLGDLSSLYIWFSLFILCAYALLGFFDDWKKIDKQNSKGLSGRAKLYWQAGLALLVAAALWASGFSTVLTFPIFKELSLDLGIFFLPFAALVIVGSSNAVNLTDGLDGLAIGPVMTVSIAYSIFCYVGGHAVLSDYLGIQHVSGLGEISIVLSAVVAAGLGFLWYNTFPAQIFMGDTGSLALGGLIGLVAVFSKHELILVIAGGIFVIEALSVIVQVYSFKWTGKRVFRMAPIHHHFELKGWAEPKIIVRFWIISIVLALISLTTLKLR